MTYKMGEYVVGNGITFHINTKGGLQIVNDKPHHFRKATQEEIDKYHEEN